VTQGNWTNVYGSDGFAIANGSYNNPPTYATYNVSATGGASSYTWQPSTSQPSPPTDPRALQVSPGSSTRIASTYFTTSSQVMTVSLSDGNTHRVALYFLDWSNNGRSQVVTISDAGSNAVLDTETVDNFNNGVWLVWNISGNVNISIDCTSTVSGDNPVVSGLFFDPVGTPSASFVRADTATQGNWTGVYGADGFQIADGTNNILPPYVSAFNVSANGGSGTYTWANPTSDPRALQVSSGSSTRIASTWFTTSSQLMTINLNDSNMHQIALYFLDWSDNGRAQTITITNASSNAVLDTETLSSFNNGNYLVWNISGNVNVTIDCTSTASGDNPLFSGIFFAPPSAATGSSAYTISGQVLTSSNTALSGVTVTLSGGGSGSVVTDSTGTYSFNLTSGNSYFVTPSLAGYSFSPSSPAFYSVYQNLTQTFVGTQGTVTSTPPGGSLVPSSPTKEFLYLGGRLVAIQEQGSGTQANTIGATHRPAAATSSSSASTASTTPTNNAPPPTLPTPGAMPQNTSGTPAPLPVATPASTHTTAH
jgi:hypothetical protein